MPGFLLALSGLILFAFCEKDENYWYIHSLWHILIASSILFFLPHKGFYKRGNAEKNPKESFANHQLEMKERSEITVPLVIRKTSGYFCLAHIYQACEMHEYGDGMTLINNERLLEHEN
jgi:hypothetical protein